MPLPGWLSLRASNEHIHIVHVLRARRAPDRSFPASQRFPKYRWRGILLCYSLNDGFCEFESHCMPKECHESYPGLLWMFGTIDG